MTDKIYQIFTGKSEEEHFTFEVPVISTSGDKLLCTKLRTKLSVTRYVINQEIIEHFSSDEIEESEFELDNGVVIKTLDGTTLEWLYRSKDDAELLLTEKELLTYRTVIPKLIEQRGGNNGRNGTIARPITGTVTSQNNFLIDY